MSELVEVGQTEEQNSETEERWSVVGVKSVSVIGFFVIFVTETE